MWNPIDDMGTGNRGDSIIAHITPKEAAILAMRGGAGTVNPKTGLLQFYDTSRGGVGDDPAAGDYGGWGDVGTEVTGNENSSGNLGFGVNNDLNEILSSMEQTSQFNQGFASDVEGEAPMSWTENKLENMDIGLHNFKVDPLGSIVNALTPSMQTVGTVLGMLSPLPFGSIMGGYIGKTIDKNPLDKTATYPGVETLAANNDPMESGSVGVPDTTIDYGYEPAPAVETPVETAPAVTPTTTVDETPETTATSLIKAALSEAVKKNNWSSVSDRGTGGGGLGRLLRG
jgi:hypothetical protein